MSKKTKRVAHKTNVCSNLKQVVVGGFVKPMAPFLSIVIRFGSILQYINDLGQNHITLFLGTETGKKLLDLLFFHS